MGGFGPRCGAGAELPLQQGRGVAQSRAARPRRSAELELTRSPVHRARRHPILKGLSGGDGRSSPVVTWRTSPSRRLRGRRRRGARGRRGPPPRGLPALGDAADGRPRPRRRRPVARRPRQEPPPAAGRGLYGAAHDDAAPAPGGAGRSPGQRGTLDLAVAAGRRLGRRRAPAVAARRAAAAAHRAARRGGEGRQAGRADLRRRPARLRARRVQRGSARAVPRVGGNGPAPGRGAGAARRARRGARGAGTPAGDLPLTAGVLENSASGWSVE